MQTLLGIVFQIEAVAGKAREPHGQHQQQAVLHPQLTNGTAQANGQSRHFPAIARDRIVLDAAHLMPKQQIAVVERQGIPFLEIHLDLHLITPDLLEAHQRRISSGGSLHEDPALHLWRQQPFQALKLTHERGRLKGQGQPSA